MLARRISPHDPANRRSTCAWCRSRLLLGKDAGATERRLRVNFTCCQHERVRPIGRARACGDRRARACRVCGCADERCGRGAEIRGVGRHERRPDGAVGRVGVGIFPAAAIGRRVHEPWRPDRHVWRGLGIGFEAGANLFLSPHAGIQFLFHRDSSDISGVNTPYDTALQYTSRPPPDNLPIPVTIHQSSPWPDTTGSLTRTDASLNGIVRMGSGKVSATMSGGLTFERVGGTLQPLAFTTYRLGGHSVLFEDDFLLAASLEPTNAVGFNAGGDVSVRFTGRRADGGLPVSWRTGHRHAGSSHTGDQR